MSKKITKIIVFLSCEFLIVYRILIICYRKIINREKEIDKFKAYYNMVSKWVVIKQQKERIDEYILKKGYKSIAIYGMGDIGNLFYDEIKNGCVEIKYAIDKNADERLSQLKIVGINHELELVDAIIVTAVFAFDEIREELEKMTSCPIIALDDLLYEIN